MGVLSFLLIVVTAHAAAPCTGPYCNGGGSGNSFSSDSGFYNPLNPAFSSIPTFISAALKALVRISLPIVTVFIVYSGFLFVSARGNQEKLSAAKNNFLYVMVGALLILGAWVIANLIAGTVTQLTGNT